MTGITQPTIITIFGITGDLASRSLLPALEAVASNGTFPDQTTILGITRRPIDFDQLIPKEQFPWLHEHLEIMQLDPVNEQEYAALVERIDQVDQQHNGESQKIFYLSVPPAIAKPIVDCLGNTGLAGKKHVKLLLEKPFGVDLESAKELVDHIHEHFREDQIYRIDHFLAKEMAQNLVVFRAANSLFRHTWNHEFIEHITVTASEEIGIEGRANFYEQTGALRDLVQSHLLQLAALVLMDLPVLEQPEQLPERRLDALRTLRLGAAIPEACYRAQYDTYRQETQNPESNVETMLRVRLMSTSDRWKHVPITIETGKKLAKTYNEIRIHYRQDHAREANELILRIQPDEGIRVALWVKKPGYDRQFEERELSFSYNDGFESNVPKAYERVFVDAMRGDHSLFATSDEVIESWRIIQPILDFWRSKDAPDLALYPAGSDIRELQ